MSVSPSTSTRRSSRLCTTGPDAPSQPGLPHSGEPQRRPDQDFRRSGFAACGLDGDRQNAAQARGFVASTLYGWGVQHLAPDASLVVSELVTNAIRHALDPASTDNGDYPVWLGLFLHPGDLVCAVTDPSSAPPCPRQADGRATGGRGLTLISSLCESWSWSLTPPQGKTVWATLPLRSPAV
ncbi:ATP-binding protein [Streptomyces sp. NBC_00829]|uniref:ATP-binding protein n=1 Tax=Streptomyces sp. NBC_00829 TaxID=2903679 RepID=UPI0038681956|nr:ATP-binding protein [Streptomyces sp. NBC_00829]